MAVSRKRVLRQGLAVVALMAIFTASLLLFRELIGPGQGLVVSGALAMVVMLTIGLLVYYRLLDQPDREQMSEAGRRLRARRKRA